MWTWLNHFMIWLKLKLLETSFVGISSLRMIQISIHQQKWNPFATKCLMTKKGWFTVILLSRWHHLFSKEAATPDHPPFTWKLVFKEWYLHPPKLNIAPEKLPGPNRKVVFQPPFFRGELLNFGGGSLLSLATFVFFCQFVRLLQQSLLYLAELQRPDASLDEDFQDSLHFLPFFFGSGHVFLFRKTHTCTRTKASCAEVMKEDVPFCMIVKQTAWEKEKPTLKTKVSTKSPCQLQWNSRYVTMISRDITSIIQCLRWCKTECAACTPCKIEFNGNRSFTSFQTVHTHTHTRQRPGVQVSQLHNKVSRPYWKWTKWSKLHTTVSMHCHQWVRVLPTKLINARPTEWRDTFGHMPATQLVPRHCNPPHASYATKRPGTAGQTHAGTAFIHDKCSFLERLEALPHLD